MSYVYSFFPIEPDPGKVSDMTRGLGVPFNIDESQACSPFLTALLTLHTHSWTCIKNVNAEVNRDPPSQSTAWAHAVKDSLIMSDTYRRKKRSKYITHHQTISNTTSILNLISHDRIQDCTSYSYRFCFFFLYCQQRTLVLCSEDSIRLGWRGKVSCLNQFEHIPNIFPIILTRSD